MAQAAIGRRPPGSAVDFRALARWLSPFMVWGLVAVTAMVMVLVGFLALVKPFGTTPVGTAVGSHLKPDSKPKLRTETDSSRIIQKAEMPIIVRAEGEYEHEFPAQKLLEAMKTAMGARGWVELRNREPLRLTGNESLDFISGQGRLIVRAAQGFQPVIELELKGTKPLLRTGSAVSLELSGLTIIVRYPQQGARFLSRRQS